jgi:prepilin-type N-terminal cleavage/methylation domain-containing protein
VKLRVELLASCKGLHPGFTLVEVTVTLTIMGFILLMIFGVFHLGVSAWEKGDFLKEKYQKMRVSSQMLSRQFKSAVPYKIRTSKAEGDYLAFAGRQTSLKFVTALPLRSRQAEGLVYAVYEFVPGPREGGRLIQYEQRVLNKDFMDEKPREELGVILFEGIADIRFEYYREENQDKNWTPGWVTEWSAKEEKELPRAMRMTLVPMRMANKEEAAFTITTSFPSYRYEDMKANLMPRIVPRTLPQMIPGK